MINNKDKSKYTIKQFILNDDINSQGVWDEITKSISLTNEAIIGYHFNSMITKGVIARIMNLYIISRAHYNGLEVSKESLCSAWELFLSNPTEMRFQNPPLKEWFDTKLNWCKKLAYKISDEYQEPADEILSLIYFTITKLYNRGNVYMGNLGYIETSVYNELRMAFRRRKREPLTLSLDDIISDNDDSLKLEDMIPFDDTMSDERLEYQELLAKAISLLETVFSPREIDSILNGPQNCLPRQTYLKLAKFRKDHEPSELYE